MKKIIIIVLVFLVVVLGGAGGLVMLGIVRNPFRPPPPPTQAEVDAAAQDTGRAPHEQLQLVKVQDTIIPVIINDEVQRRVSLSLRLVAKQGAKDEVADELPKFQDTLLQDMVVYFQDYYQHHENLDIDMIKSKVVSDAQKVYGDTVTDVLLVNVFESGSGNKEAPSNPE